MFHDSRRRADTVDLTEDLSVTHRLIDDAWAWRHRLVEEFELGLGDHVRVKSSYQVELPPLFIEEFDLTRAERVKILLPLTVKPKQPLLRFGLTGPDGSQAPLLLRSSIAAIQAEYLRTLAVSSPGGTAVRTGLPASLCEAISVFTPAVFREFAFKRGSSDAYRAYLEDGLGFPVRGSEVSGWLAIQEEVRQLLTAHLGEPADPLSSSEQILLALPRVDPRPSGPAEVHRMVRLYAAAVEAAHRAEDGPLLTALAEYGRRWEVIVETTIPVHEPSTIKLTEDRPLEMDRRGSLTQRIALGDARSVHFEARVLDHRVEVQDFAVFDLNGDVVGIPILEGVRQSPEYLTLYSSEPERPFFVDVVLRLRPSDELRATAWMLLLLTVLGTAVAARWGSHDLMPVLGVVTFPTTFAVAVLLLREETAITTKRIRSVKYALIVSIATLWTVVFARLFGIISVVI